MEAGVAKPTLTETAVAVEARVRVKSVHVGAY
jgi:hypothetical protein